MSSLCRLFLPSPWERRFLKQIAASETTRKQDDPSIREARMTVSSVNEKLYTGRPAKLDVYNCIRKAEADQSYIWLIKQPHLCATRVFYYRRPSLLLQTDGSRPFLFDAAFVDGSNCAWTHQTLYTVSPKIDHQLIAITLSKLNRFSKSFHRWKEE